MSRWELSFPKKHLTQKYHSKEASLGRKRLHYLWIIALYCSEIWTLRKLDQKYLESFSCRGMEKIKLSEIVANEVLERVGEKKIFLNNILRRKANWFCHIIRRNCLLCDTIKGQMTERSRKKKNISPWWFWKQKKTLWP